MAYLGKERERERERDKVGERRKRPTRTEKRWVRETERDGADS
jgi:hypothetical protein